MKEQGFQNEFDELDAIAVHITVYVDGILAGCARCFPKEDEKAWVFGRIAVLPQFRHQGLGGVLLSEMEKIVRSQKGSRCILDAQCPVSYTHLHEQYVCTAKGISNDTGNIRRFNSDWRTCRSCGKLFLHYQISALEALMHAQQKHSGSS